MHGMLGADSHNINAVQNFFSATPSIMIVNHNSAKAP